MKFTFAILFAALLIPACNRNEPQSTQAAPEERANATQMKAERDRYVEGIEARLSEMDKKMEGLNERASVMKGAAKTDFNNANDNLQAQRKSVASRLDELKSVSIESWTTVKGEVDSALANLERSYEQVSNRFQNVPGPATPKATR